MHVRSEAQREPERVCEAGAELEGVEGVISVCCSHTRFYLGKQRGEDNRKRGHVLKYVIYCCPDDILVTRKPPEIGLFVAPHVTLQGFQGQAQEFQEGSRNEALTDGNIYFFGSLPFRIFSELWMD